MDKREKGSRVTFVDGVTGLGCEAKNIESLEEAIELFLTLSPEKHETMGKSGRTKMELEFD